MAKVISIEDIQDGMILAEDLTNEYGQILLPANIELKTKHIKILKTWRINSIIITSGAVESDDIPEEVIKKAATILYGRLDWKPTHIMEKQLLQACLFKLARDIMNQQDDYYD